MTRDEAKKQLMGVRRVTGLLVGIAAGPAIFRFFSMVTGFGPTNPAPTWVVILVFLAALFSVYALADTAVAEIVLLIANGRSQDKA
jgi:hypothetical protein